MNSNIISISVSAAPTTLKMFKEAGWMANVTRIFDLKQDGSFVARFTGIYLLYAHVSTFYYFTYHSGSF